MNAATKGSVWYREFWPWFIIALLGSVVLASFATLYLALKHADKPLQSSAYNKNALAIELPESSVARAMQLQLSASLSVLPEQQLRVVLNSMPSYQPAVLTLWLNHPFNPDDDLEIRLHRIEGNLYLSAMPQGLKGKWKLALQDPNDNWQLETTTQKIEALLQAEPIALSIHNE
jgi:hypothetical protein